MQPEYDGNTVHFDTVLSFYYYLIHIFAIHCCSIKLVYILLVIICSYQYQSYKLVLKPLGYVLFPKSNKERKNAK